VLRELPRNDIHACMYFTGVHLSTYYYYYYYYYYYMLILYVLLYLQIVFIHWLRIFVFL